MAVVTWTSGSCLGDILFSDVSNRTDSESMPQRRPLQQGYVEVKDTLLFSCINMMNMIPQRRRLLV